MDILQSIRIQNLPDLKPIEAYDLWNDAGSKRALKVLNQYSKATPVSVMLNDSGPCIIKIK
jgi:hypothetical protein